MDGGYVGVRRGAYLVDEDLGERVPDSAVCSSDHGEGHGERWEFAKSVGKNQQELPAKLMKSFASSRPPFLELDFKAQLV